MGRTSRRRRRAALREQDRRRTDGAHPDGPADAADGDDPRGAASARPRYSESELRDLLHVLAHLASRGESLRYVLDRRLRDLVDTMAAPAHWGVLATAIDGHLGDRVANARRHGWEPADLAHGTRQVVSARAARLVGSFSAEKMADTGSGSGHGSGFEAWRIAESLDQRVALSEAVQVISLLTSLGPIPRATARSSVRVDDQMLAKVRALLAKAEATTFPAEAEAFTAKAQELMSRHRIDAAMVAASIDGFGRPSGTAAMAVRRVHLDDPYSTQKAELLHVVAEANDTRSVYSPRVRIATVVGHASDLDLAEMLFTSLLLQATQAMGEAGRHHATDRSATFRRSFLGAYTMRIRERLAEAERSAQADGERTYGAALVPVLRARSEQVEAALAELFPTVRPAGGSNTIDPRGWAAGRAAADRADVGGRRGRLAS